jgi:hypothetical protein
MFAVACIGTIGIDASAREPAPGHATVGEFVTRLAVALEQDGRNVESSYQALERLGVRLAVDAAAPLTDGIVARIASGLGVGIVAPADPAATVSAPRAGVLAGLIGTGFVESRAGAASIEPPAECLRSINRGQCVECCKEAVGQVPNKQGNLRDPGRECSKFCRNNVPPPPSDEEPQP